MKIEVPAGHQIGEEVPDGGSNCAKCRFISADEKHCEMRYWVDAPKKDGGGGGDSKLPKPASRYCCDLYKEQNKRKTLGDQLKRHKESK
jgi:hypothetical protein